MRAMTGLSQRARGISLLEILIAMSLGAFMLVGIISLMASVSTTRTELDRSSEQMENGRYAIQILNEDAALAGYIGPYFHAAITPTDPDPCDDGNPLLELGVVYDKNAPQLPTAISGVASGNALPACVTAGSAMADAEVLVVRRVNTDSVSAAMAVDGDPYFQFSFCDGEAEFVFSNVKADFTLTGRDCATASPVWSYESRAYYVASCDECGGGGDGIPTLKVVEFSSGALSNPPRSLVEGIEDMHIEYGMDLNADGAPDCYVDDPTVGALPAGCAGTWFPTAEAEKNWANVVSVEVNFLVRSLNTYPGWKDTKTYDLGRGARVGPFGDSFKRRVLATSILIQNISGVRE